MTVAKGTFEVTSMGEETIDELDGGGKLTRSSGGQQFTGAIEGEGWVEWLMCFSPEGSSRFVGLNRITGSIDGRSGTIVIESVGDFDGAASTGSWTVVAASGDLEDLTGKGSFDAASGRTVSYQLEYELEAK